MTLLGTGDLLGLARFKRLDFSKINGSKYVGASYHKASGLWRATLRRKHIGYFDTPQEAHEAYKKAAVEIYGEFAHTSLTRAGPLLSRSK